MYAHRCGSSSAAIYEIKAVVTVYYNKVYSVIIYYNIV